MPPLTAQTLQDILLQGQMQSPPGLDLASLFAGGVGSAAPSPTTPVPPVDTNQPNVDQAFGFTPQPVPNDVSPGRRALVGILASLGAALQARGGITPNYGAIDQLNQLRKRREDAMAANAAGQGAATRAKAQYGLRKAESDAARKEAAAQEAAQRDFTLGRDKAAAAERQALADQEAKAKAAEAERNRQFEADQNALKAKRDMELQVLRGKQDLQQINARGASEDRVLNRQVEGEQRTAASTLKSMIVGAVPGIQKELEAGASPDEIRQRILDQIDVHNLDGKHQEDVMRFWIQRAEPLLRQAEAAQMSQQLAAGSPQESFVQKLAPNFSPGTFGGIR